MQNYSLDFQIGKLNCRLISPPSSPVLSQPTNTYYEHVHSCVEFHYIEEGSCEFICSKRSFPLTKGQLLAVPPRSYHRQMKQSENFRKFSLLINILPPSKYCSDSDMLFYKTIMVDKPSAISIKTPELHAAFARMSELRKATEIQYAHTEKIRALCNLLLVELFEEIVDHDKIKKELTVPSISWEEYIIDNFTALKFAPKSSFGELADQLHVSKRQLHRMIKQKYNTNYRDKMKELRVEIATGFLCGTDKSISEISELLGYNNISAFSAFIKNATGKTPTQIRKDGAQK